MILVFVFLAVVYVRGWLHLHKASANPVRAWRAASFLTGLFLVWGALGSPLVAYDHHLLTVHMIQHLLLMTVAPPLILLGEPHLAFWHGLPRVGRGLLGWALQRSIVRRFARTLSRPTLCWTVSTLTLVGWHVPALLTLAMHSTVWHSFEQSSFLGAGFLFWWPVVQPWPRLSTLLYLFLATLPCDVLSGFLVFSERVAYPVYLSAPRHANVSVLDDQQLAGALMWTAVTIIYLVAGVIVATRSLSRSVPVELPSRFDVVCNLQSGLVP
jgi:putative membrane protein